MKGRKVHRALVLGFLAQQGRRRQCCPWSAQKLCAIAKRRRRARVSCEAGTAGGLVGPTASPPPRRWAGRPRAALGPTSCGPLDAAPILGAGERVPRH